MSKPRIVSLITFVSEHTAPVAARGTLCLAYLPTIDQVRLPGGSVQEKIDEVHLPPSPCCDCPARRRAVGSGDQSNPCRRLFGQRAGRRRRCQSRRRCMRHCDQHVHPARCYTGGQRPTRTGRDPPASRHAHAVDRRNGRRCRRHRRSGHHRRPVGRGCRCHHDPRRCRTPGPCLSRTWGWDGGHFYLPDGAQWSSQSRRSHLDREWSHNDCGRSVRVQPGAGTEHHRRRRCHVFRHTRGFGDDLTQPVRQQSSLLWWRCSGQ